MTSGLAAVLFGVLPLYVALLAAFLLPNVPLRPRLLVGVGIAFCGLVVAFGESLDLGSGEYTALAFAGKSLNSEAPSVAYAAVYPLTMLLRVLCAQALILLFMR